MSQVAFLVAGEGIERVELTEPWQAVTDAGHEPVLISLEPGEVQTFDHLDKADTHTVDVVVRDASVDDYAALVLPGGVANPDALRLDDDAVRLIKSFFETGRPVAAICHAPWTLIEADAVRDRTLTSWPSLATDLRNAGAHWVDEQVYVCGGGPNTLITSRKPADLKAFNETIVSELGG